MLEAAGTYRRTDLERRDQQVSWERPDKAFFAAGACHVLAWACLEVHADRPLRLAAIRTPGVEHHHRPPRDFWADPRPRAQAYVRRFVPPWIPGGEPVGPQ